MKQTALIFYVKNPGTQKVKTRLAAGIGERAAVEFYENCLIWLRDDIKNLEGLEGERLKIFLAPSDPADSEWTKSFFGREVIPQSSGDLGDRITASFKEASSRGFSQIAMMGSDAPSLSLEVIQKCLSLMDTDDSQKFAVLGPAEDGGYYFIGVSSGTPNFKFPGYTIEWSTEKTLETTRRSLEAQGYLVRLGPVGSDFDTVEDFEKVRFSESRTAELDRVKKWIHRLG